MTTSIKPAHGAPTSKKNGPNTKKGVSEETARGLSVLALSMSLQLLIVVLVPILGGHWLDTRFGHEPLWTAIGLVIGIGGTILVVTQTMRKLNDYMGVGTKGPKV